MGGRRLGPGLRGEFRPARRAAAHQSERDGGKSAPDSRWDRRRRSRRRSRGPEQRCSDHRGGERAYRSESGSRRRYAAVGTGRVCLDAGSGCVSRSGVRARAIAVGGGRSRIVCQDAACRSHRPICTSRATTSGDGSGYPRRERRPWRQRLGRTVRVTWTPSHGVRTTRAGEPTGWWLRTPLAPDLDGVVYSRRETARGPWAGCSPLRGSPSCGQRGTTGYAVDQGATHRFRRVCGRCVRSCVRRAAAIAEARRAATPGTRSRAFRRAAGRPAWYVGGTGVAGPDVGRAARCAGRRLRPSRSG